MILMMMTTTTTARSVPVRPDRVGLGRDGSGPGLRRVGGKDNNTQLNGNPPAVDCNDDDNDDNAGDSDGNGNGKSDGDGKGNGGGTPCNNNNNKHKIQQSTK